jgi:plastocyanin
VRSRTRQLSLIAAGLAVAGALLLGGAAQGQAPAKAAIVAYDNVFRTVDGNEANVTIVAGGHVDFSYPEGASRHNVVFTGLQPSLCGISQPPSSLTKAPLPSTPTGPLWEGGCDFAVAGAYPFVCGLHSNMTGTVTVVAPGTAPPPPPPATPLAPAGSALRVTSVQRGTSVRGSVRVRSAGSRLLARAFARRRSLSGGTSNALVASGRQLRSSVSATRVSFSVPLSAAARRALGRNGRLAVTLRLTVTPPSGLGPSYTAVRSVILHPAL